MALVRILVDGYSLLHNWPELAPGRPRHSQAAREGLVAVLSRYRDASGTPISLIFDGSGAPATAEKPHSTAEFEILYSGPGQTADDVIERVTHRMVRYGEVLVVTDDRAERDTVLSLGGSAASCEQFIVQVNHALTDLGRDLDRVNRRELRRFNRPRVE
ncbi:MAG TPA: hypothetical protein DCY13_07790 [Verrucomicrobiales bacterium]|nr:hypothetical protein [Verrucomicrobiales bacterium]